MRYSFRLAEVVGHVTDPRKRPGTIKSICEYTGLDRHQVAALLKNEVKYIPLDALSKLCDYLIERGFVSADELPGRLFAVEPEHFWELLARRRRLELCIGVRHGDSNDSLDDAWVVASDSVLLGELLNGVTSLGGSARHPQSEVSSPEPGKPPKTAGPHPEHLHQSLVWSPAEAKPDEYRALAREVYDSFCGAAGDKALISLGSVKSNPTVEIMVANAFGSEPFVPQAKLAAAARRRCPFYFFYRPNDPQVPSCCGGMDLAQDQSSGRPGIYYEQANGKWDLCPWDENTQDAAFVFYIHRESQGRLEMVLGGYSGRATRLLARMLARRGEEFWPPVYSDYGIQIGAFLVKFSLTGSPGHDRELLQTDVYAGTEIIRVDKQVIERRMTAVAPDHVGETR